MHRLTRIPALMIFLAVILGACVTVITGKQLQGPELIARTPTGGSIVGNGNMRPKPIAVAHCAQFGKQAYFKDVDRVGESIRGDWEDRTYIYHFDCL